MSKRQIILKYFQKRNQLGVGNTKYKKNISSLFAWLVKSDNVTNDKTTKYLPNIKSQAKIIAKTAGIAAGLEEVTYFLKKYTSLVLKPSTKDGLPFKNGQYIGYIKGDSHEILVYERTILNILQRMSGIATETNRLVKIINQEPRTKNQERYLAATRKTPWMWLDKKAVAVGGGLTHRLDLSDGILIKDNHLSGKSIESTLKTISTQTRNELIEIEVESEIQTKQAIATFQQFGGSNNLAILFDNFTPAQIKTALANLSVKYDLSTIIFEASGGINEKNINLFLNSGVDIISSGSLTHSTKATDISMEFSN